MTVSLIKDQGRILINLLEHDNERYKSYITDSMDDVSKDYYKTLIKENNEILKKLNAYI